MQIANNGPKTNNRQWFVENMRRLLQTLPPQARAICRCRIQLTTADGRLVEQFLDDAIQEHLSQVFFCCVIYCRYFVIFFPKNI